MEPITVRTGRGGIRLEPSPGSTLLDVLRAAGLAVEAPCGGGGKCGKCAVELLGPGGAERVLSCRVPASAAAGRTVLLREREGGGDIEASGGPIEASGTEAGLAAAVDLGTTTLAVRIIDRASGAELSRASGWNAQLPYGADVISRIKYASDGGLETLTGLVRSQAAALISEACRAAGINPGGLGAVLCCGNTTMEHLFAGISPEGIGRAPFVPATLFSDGGQVELDGLPNAAVRLAPCVSGYVGGDTTAAVYASGLASGGGTRLLLDVGTNGELVLARDGRLTACSVACGPAFEGAELQSGMRSGPGAVSRVRYVGGDFRLEVIGGGEPRGLCGSGAIDLLAALVETGAVDGSGCLLPPGEAPEGLRRRLSEDENGLGVFSLAPGVCFTAADVRKLQLARAAVRAGVEILLRREGVDAADVDEVLLAGGFGTRIDPASAAAAGLIPAQLAPKVRAVGNAALDGAHRALCKAGGFAELAAISAACGYIELSTSPEFSDAFVDAMAFYDDESKELD